MPSKTRQRKAGGDESAQELRHLRLMVEQQARELSEAREQQLATGAILRAIAGSPTDVEPVLNAVVESATRLCSATFGQIFKWDGTLLRWAAAYGMAPEFTEIQRERVYRPGRHSLVARTALNMRVTIIDDALEDPDYAYKEHAEFGNYRTMLGVPLLRAGELIGVLALVHDRVEPFTDRQIEMVTTFADQAAIAIENTRVFEELQARNRELTEALEQQTATGTILRAIAASPTDVQPVLDTVAESAARLCEAFDALVLLKVGDLLCNKAHHGPMPTSSEVWPVGRALVSGRAVVDRKPIHVHDLLEAADEFPASHDLVVSEGQRTVLAVPLLSKGESIGALCVRRHEVRPFTQRQIDLLVLFADQAAIAIENTRLFQEVQTRNRELTEALEQQTATGTILRAIAASPTDVDPVLNTVVESAAKLCGAYDSAILLSDGEALAERAHYGPIPIDFARWPIGRDWVTGRAYVDREPIHVHDLLEESEEFPFGSQTAKRHGYRTMLAVPLMREDKAIGVLILRRREVRPFTQKQIALLVLFAHQATIAIENARLFEELQTRNSELTQALEQQTATGTILRAIATSPADAGPVLKTVAESAARLCQAYDVVILLAEGDRLIPRAHHGPIPLNFAEWPIARDWVTGRAVVDGKPIHVHDIKAAKDEYPTGHDLAAHNDGRTVLAVPLLREGKPIGAIAVRRREVRPFSQKQVDLLVLFADQAAIAIENARLFEELQSRNRELTEALEQQTATGTILRAIAASPADLQPVLGIVAESAARLCEAHDAAILLDEGDALRVRAHHGPIPIDFEKWPISRDLVTGRAFIDRQPVHVHDLMQEGDEFPVGIGMAKRFGHRTMLAVPLLREGKAIGALIIRRMEVRPFSQRQIDLLVLFADQAVIAIENARLFEELQARTRELQETLDYQTAIGEVLNVISRSPSDVQPVLDVILQTAVRLCDADGGTIAREQNGEFIRSGQVGFSPEFGELMAREPVQRSRGTITGRTLIEGKVVQVLDAQSDPEYTWSEALKLAEMRSLLGVPLLRDNTTIGVIALIRRTVRPFTEKQVDLVTTFADQAVIAIENARLFEEVQARTSDLARSVEELEALGEVSQSVNSTLDLKTVLETIVTKAVQLSRTDAGAIYVYSRQADNFRLRATYGMSPELIAAISDQSIRLNDPGIGDAARSRQSIQTEDLTDHAPTRVQQLVLAAGFHSVLVVPLLRPDRVIGALVVRRHARGRLPDSTVHLLETFAAQSVLAIQNARLFSEIEEKGRQLEIASRHKSQFLANMSHELRTPLNSVLGFTEMLSDGLYGELPAKAKTTLGRVEANGRHLLGLINDVLDLSKIEAGQLTLSLDDYAIGQVVKTVAATTEPLARAKGLILTATVADGLPLGRGDERRLSQVLLNLAGNAVKFTEAGSIEIAAGARDGRFEILVKDTGPGVAPEHQRRIFEEFQQIDDSNTRQKGGTGLGLAISKRIVEMHGGTIGIESVPGSGSTFRVTIPIRVNEGIAAA